MAFIRKLSHISVGTTKKVADYRNVIEKYLLLHASRHLVPNHKQLLEYLEKINARNKELLEDFHKFRHLPPLKKHI